MGCLALVVFLPIWTAGLGYSRLGDLKNRIGVNVVEYFLQGLRGLLLNIKAYLLSCTALLRTLKECPSLISHPGPISEAFSCSCVDF